MFFQYITRESWLSLFINPFVPRLKSLTQAYEVIFVDDGSTDGTLPELLTLANSDLRITVVELTRNFGNAMATATGLEFASVEWVVTMDSDFEDRPEDIGELYRTAREGYALIPDLA